MTSQRRNRHESSDRVLEMLSKMTLDDKIGQMSQIDLAMLLEDDPNGDGKQVAQGKLEYFFGARGIGSLLNNVAGSHWEARQYRDAMVRIQEIARNHGRPPVIWGLDSLHGANYVHKAIVTPQPINLAATFNVTVAYLAGQLASRDTRAAGIAWLFSPVLGIALQPKWSRVYETLGEDPKVVSDMGAAMVTGIQEPGEGIPSRAAANAKHFIGYSNPRNGHDRSPSWIPTRHLYQYFLPPWRAALKDALTVMESYTDYDGVPNVVNRNSLRHLLRQQLGFDGVVLTDYSEILNLHYWHHIVSSDEDATIYALNEGSVDMNMIPYDIDSFRNAIQAGIAHRRLPMERIDESVERILRLKEELGMFDETMVLEDVNLDKVGNPTDRNEALEMARQGIVMVENRDSVLPLDPSQKLKIHVTGPTANVLRYQTGGWTWQWQGAPADEGWFTYGATVLDAAKVASTSWDVSYSCGVGIMGDECDDPVQGKVNKETSGVISKIQDWVGMGHGDETTSILQAANIASQADYVFVCVGEEAYAEKPGDIRSLDLPQGQIELVRALSEGSAKIILVYFGGRPRLLRDMADIVDAVLIGFLPGPDAGTAVMDIVTGKVNPSGRLPLTYPSYDDAAGAPYYHAISDQCTRGEGQLPHYDYAQCDVQWPFGHGLSYASFEYSNLFVSSKILKYSRRGQNIRKDQNNVLTVSVRLKNVSSRPGSETVMFFTFDESRQTSPEYKRLRAFEKVYLMPGEERLVTTTMSMDDPDFQSIGPHDDTHLVVQNRLQFRVGIGALTDCRQGGDDLPMCSDYVTVETGDDYVAACDAACNIWMSSPCGKSAFMSYDRCWAMCTSSGSRSSDGQTNGDGWGWNYVDCVERAMFDISDGTEGAQTECWQMTTLCRDVLAEESSYASHTSLPSVGAAIALLAGLIASFIILFALSGRWREFRLMRRERREYGQIQFSVVDSVLD